MRASRKSERMGKNGPGVLGLVKDTVERDASHASNVGVIKYFMLESGRVDSPWLEL